MAKKDIFDISGKVALVTGGGSGIGRTICETLAEYGAAVVCVSRTEEKLRGTISLIKQYGHPTLAIQADVTNPDEVAQMVNETVSKLGTVDILFNSAGISLPPVRVGELPVEEWDRVMDTDLKGVFLCMRAVLPVMLKQHRGSIVNISSVSSLRASNPQVAPASYCAAKAGVNSLTQCAAVEYATDGIRVNCIIPGVHDTGFANTNDESQKKKNLVMEEIISKHLPMQRRGKLEELKGLIIYLASDASSYATGQVFISDGGRTSQM
jgi:NAD(P)-dependent dehydrogenase (short-subunit alcohol dehydrogenase family)